MPDPSINVVIAQATEWLFAAEKEAVDVEESILVGILNTGAPKPWHVKRSVQTVSDEQKLLKSM